MSFKDQAREKLEKVWKNLPNELDNEWTERINEAIERMNKKQAKAFNYMLFSAILTKATHHNINAFSLQASSGKNGYDARSMCSKVIIPFEDKYLENILGSTGDPLVGKPGRYPCISKKNKTRNKDGLKALYNFICELEQSSPSEVHECLIAYLYIQRQASLKLKIERMPPTPQSKETFIWLSQVCRKILKKCHNGETSLAVAAFALFLLTRGRKGVSILVHHVNMSGKSKRQKGDIDVYCGPDLLYVVEVKDKEFSLRDIKVAAKKLIDHPNLLFLCGPRGKNIEKKRLDTLSKEATKATGKNVFCYRIENYLRMCYSLSIPNSLECFSERVWPLLNNMSPVTKNWIKTSLE